MSQVRKKEADFDLRLTFLMFEMAILRKVRGREPMLSYLRNRPGANRGHP